MVNKIKNLILFKVTMVSLLILSLVLVGCGNQSTPSSSQQSSSQSSQADSASPQKGGTLRLAISTNVVQLGFTPNVTAYSDFIVAGTALESLGRFDAAGKMQPWLAESWQQDPAAKTITIKLKKGIKFHDGTDFNAQAVKWNLDQFQQAKRAEVKAIKSTDVVDDYTVRLNLEAWDSGLLDSVGYFVLMMSPASFEKNGKDWAVKHPVGTGPFQFVSWEPDVAVKFKKFDGYWQPGKPYLDAVEWRIITDSMTATAAFKAKEIDEYVSIPTDMTQQLEGAGATIVRLKTGLGANAVGLTFDSANPKSPFADVRVRQAVSYAIDTKSIVQNLLSGNVIVNNQWGVPGSWSYNPDVKGYPYDPDKAKKLLADAGYPNGFKTKFTVANNPELVKVMTAVQSYLSKIGIDAQLDLVDTAKYRAITDNKSSWEGIINYSGRGDADVVTYMPRNFSASGVLYVKGIVHPEKIENLLTEAAKAPDIDTKKNLAYQLQKAVYDEYCLVTPMYVNTMPAAKYPKVHDEGINMTHASVWTPADAWISK